MLAFSTIGLTFYYIAFRYNLLFVNTSKIDTKGLVYPKALQHTIVGCYLLVICLIGLFACAAAPAPLVLMVIFLVVMILYHISLNNAVRPLLYYLPRSLEAEEDALLQMTNGSNGVNGHEKSAINGNGAIDTNSSALQVSDKKPSMFKKFLRPDIHCNYASMRRLVPHDFADIRYSPEIERDAFQHPSVTNVTPLLWVPRDEMGVSRQECEHTNKVTPMTDEGAFFNEKGKIVWDVEGSQGRPPIWEEPIFY